MLSLFLPVRSIARKLQLILMGMAIFAAILTAGILSAYEIKNTEKSQLANLNAMALILAPNLTAAILFDDKATAQELITPIAQRQDILAVRVTDASGEPFVLQEDEQQLKLASKSLPTFRTPLMLEEARYGTLEVISDRSYINERIDFYIDFLLALLGTTFVLSLLLSFFLGKHFSRPILQLTRVAAEVTQSSNYKLRATKTTNDEVGQLTQYFNSMLETIEYRETLLESLVQERTHELEKANEKLHDQAYKDSLSGLPNRLFLYEKLQALLRKHQKRSQKFALLFIDLDGFKEVNDTLGHDYGDILLVHAGQRILSCVRKSDVVARLGGDEFTVIIKWGPNRHRVTEVAENILNNLSEPFDLEGEIAYITGSMGITLFPDDGQSVDTLIKHADQAMYESKNKGKNCYHYYSPEMGDKALQRKHLTEDLRVALAEQQFELWYQPIVDLANSRCVKAEALIRWRHPEKGLIPPVEFIPIAEEVGLIHQIGEWVAFTASEQLSHWQSELNKNFQISINASPAQLQQDNGWLIRWLNHLNELKLPEGSITLEITENLLMENDEALQKQFEVLHQSGIEVAIDDFGVGYSSLSYLQQMDIDLLKIDRSFIHSLSIDGNSQALCKAIIMMAHHIGLKVVAEGIETKAQLDILMEAGCDYGQGYLFSKPVPADKFEPFLTAKVKAGLKAGLPKVNKAS